MDASSLTVARRRLLPPLEAALQDYLSRGAAGAPEYIPRAADAGAADVNRVAAPAAAHYGMMRYHLGWLDEHLAPAEAPTGKRLRPLLCLLAAEACGAATVQAMPAAVALELLHNFSLIHDDIEDNDAVRHHRPTVWSLWGQAQGINVGDGMHVLAYLALLPLAEQGVSPSTVLRLVGQLAETSLCITEGQHLDLSFERRDDVSPAEYLDMIARKSASLLSCSTVAGALIAGSDVTRTGALAQYGHQLGLGFQIRDDILGIWGRSETTGKPAGDLYRKKKTLPTLYALSRAEAEDAAALRALFAADSPGEDDVARALRALDRSGARRYCEHMIGRYSVTAREQLDHLLPSPARDALTALTVQLETREV